MEEKINAKAVKDFFDQRAENWDKEVHHQPAKIRYLLSFLDLPPPARVLDVGSGTGVLVPYLKEKLTGEGTIIELDPSSSMIEIARRKWGEEGIEYFEAEIEEFSYDKKFNCIICYSSFPHFKDKKRAVQNMFNLLTEGGLVAVLHSEGRDRINQHHQTQMVGFDPLPPIASLALLFQEVGFTIVHREDSEDYYLLIGKKVVDFSD